jgi:glycosyltransferase involved in cell wall biosynthesis
LAAKRPSADALKPIVEMKLSVRLITYNHAPFIAQAIESVLMQRTNFDFDIVIGEDDSPDGTRKIVAEYAQKYPGKIKALFHDRKNVIYYRGRPTSRYNFVETLKQCTGQYVALLDGDDFWTSPDKLQKQVDFLDQHPECAICAHDVMKLFDNAKEERWGNDRAVYDLVDLLTLKLYPPTCSVVYRNRLFEKFPDWFYGVMMNDFPLHLINARFGKIGHIPEVMATYRYHAGGLWTGWAAAGKKSLKPSVAWNEGLVDFYRTYDAASNGEFRSHIEKRIANLSYQIASAQYELRNLPEVRRNIFQALKCGAFETELPKARVARLWLAACVPFAYRAYTGAKHIVRGGKTQPGEAGSNQPV